MTTSTVTPSGWYPDPSHRHEFRYWDGKSWTSQVSDRGLTATDSDMPSAPTSGRTPAAGQTPATAAGAAAAGGAVAASRPAPPQAAPPPADPPPPAPPQAAPPQAAPPPTASAPLAPAPPGPATPAPGVPAPPQATAVAAGTPSGPLKWLAPLVAGLAALALIIGLVIWAPWSSKTPLVPTGLLAVSPTPTAVTIQWAPSTSGPTVDRYLIMRSGATVGSVAGSAITYRDSGLTPATAYQYRVVAVSGDQRSAPSSVLAFKTPTPPTAQGRLEGSFNVDSKVLSNTDPPPVVGRTAIDPWKFTPQCANGACSVAVSGKWIATPITVTLIRSGATYTGTAHPSVFTCGPSNVPMKDTMTIKITVNGAAMQNKVWTATSWTGTMTDAVNETSTGPTTSCPASTVTTSLKAIP